MLQLVDTPTGLAQSAPAQSERIAQAEGMTDEDAALQARLDNLRRE
jgi:charged multivesicular body protein 2A